MSPRKKISYKKTNSTVKVKKPTHKLNNIVEKLTKVSESPAKKSTSFKMSPGKKISYKKTNTQVKVKKPNHKLYNIVENLNKVAESKQSATNIKTKKK